MTDPKLTLLELLEGGWALGYTPTFSADWLMEKAEFPQVVISHVMTVPGRTQVGYRPPQTVTVTSLKDGLEARSFQVVRAQHRYTPGGGYVCELDLAAARLSDGFYEPKVAPAVTDVGLGLAELRRARSEAMLNSIRSVWI